MKAGDDVFQSDKTFKILKDDLIGAFSLVSEGTLSGK